MESFRAIVYTLFLSYTINPTIDHLAPFLNYSNKPDIYNEAKV